MDSLAGYGYFGLFIASFLAASVLPLSSEVVLAILLLNRYDPILTVIVATTGNVLGSVTNYALGHWGKAPLLRKVLRMSPEQITRAEGRFRRYGTLSLLFAWVPFIGDPLTVVAGLLRVNIWLFLGLVTAGKLLRYIAVTVPLAALW